MTGHADPAAIRDFARRLHAGRAFHFPVRHHSPACALHLARAFAEIRPRALVLEMPADFAGIIPLILDPATRPPVAVVSVAGPADRPDAMGYWPLSATAPELVALRAAAAGGARVLLADLPMAAKRREREEGEEAPPPVLLTDERPLSSSAYAAGVTARLGARDFDEAWDRLFESRAAEADWRGFFADVGVHCLLSRLATPEGEIAADGTLAREAFMRRVLAEAMAGTDGPVAVVTGGFHTPALLDGYGAEDEPAPALSGSRAYLVRYAHASLDRMNGYGAGMPSPRYYERLHSAIGAGEPEPFDAAATAVLLGLSERLRRDAPGFVPPLPATMAALRQARGLAELRDLPGPGRAEILDAARSCFLKDEDPRHGSPLMEALHREMTGEAIGDVPRGAGSPPLVEAVRARARALGFKVEDAGERRRDLDIHRKERHRAASRLLHALALLDTGFANFLQGPDWTSGVRAGLLFEVWTYAWSPLVEGRLVALSTEGATLDAVATALLRRRAAALEENGQGRDSDAAARLVLLAAQAGIPVGGLMEGLAAALAEDPDFARVVRCLATLDGLWRGRAVLGLTGAPALAALRAACFRRAVDLLPDVAHAAPERAGDIARALAGLHHVLDSAAEADDGLDRALFDEGVAALLGPSLPPVVGGAVGALAFLSGRLDEAGLAARVCGALAGAAADPEERAAPLAGLLLVQPALLRRCGALLAGMDAAFEAMEEPDFLAVLPHLRLALVALDPHETDDLAERVAALKGLTGPLLPAGPGVGEGEMLANVGRAAELEALLRADGLGAWLAPEGAPA